MQLYKVMNETNYPEEHTTQLTHSDAIKLINDLEEFFPNEQYSIHPDEYVEPKETRVYSSNQADGWEDLHNEYDY